MRISIHKVLKHLVHLETVQVSSLGDLLKSLVHPDIAQASCQMYISYREKRIRSIDDDQERANMITRVNNILENIIKTHSQTDYELRAKSSYERTTSLTPVFPLEKKGSDPVYRKISKLARFAYNSYAYYITDDYNRVPSLQNSIFEFAFQLKNKIQDRQMNQEEYNHIKETSMKVLLAEWLEEVRKQKSKVA